MNSRFFAAFTLVVLLAGLATAGPRLAAQTPGPDPSTRATDALNILENQDFESFEDFRAEGAVFVARVEQDGRWFRVRIDPDRHTVTEIS